MNKTTKTIAITAALTLGAACGGPIEVKTVETTAPTTTQPEVSKFQEVGRKCGVDYDKSSVIVDTAGSDDFGVGDDIADLVCVINGFDVSKSLQARFDHTNSLAGQQTQVEGDFVFSWNYHPDNGFFLAVSPS